MTELVLRDLSAGYPGRPVLAGQPVSAMTHRERGRRIGYAPQNPSLPAELTVTDYVLLGRTPHLGPLGREGAGDLAVVADVLDRLDLRALAGRRLTALSGGERQRAVLARTLAQRAGLLLLDEPTTGLDVGHAQALLELVDRLRREDGTTVLATLHDLTLAGQYAESVLLLDGGAVVAAGPPTEVLTAERIARHYAATVAVLPTEHGPAITPVRPSRAEPS
jgi:iron complex transport system ATP-binding protein